MAAAASEYQERDKRFRLTVWHFCCSGDRFQMVSMFSTPATRLFVSIPIIYFSVPIKTIWTIV